MRRIIAVLLAVMVFSSMCSEALAATLTLPRDLGIVERQAFYRNESLDEVEIPYGVTEIREKAFANSGVKTIYIPDTVTFIAEDAFLGFDELTFVCSLNSYAYSYAYEHDIERRVLGDFWVRSVTADEDLLTADVMASEDCILRVTVEDEQENELFTYYEPVEAGNNEEIDIIFTEELPEYFVLKAALTDAFNYSISETYMNSHYTEAYVEFLSKTPEDYAGKTILDYGSEGFGVLADEVKIVTGHSSGDAYRLNTDVILQVGDCVYIEDQQEFVKIKALSVNTDGSYQVIADEDIEIGDIYQHLRFESTFDAVQAMLDEGVIDQSDLITERAIGATEGKQFTVTKKVGAVTLDAALKISLSCIANFDRVILGEAFECETIAEVQGSMSASAEAGFTQKAVIPVINCDIPISAGLDLNLQYSIPLDFSAEASTNASLTYTGTLGVKYRQNEGFIPIRQLKPTPNLSSEGKVDIKFGPKLNIGIKAIKVFTIGVGAQLGGELEAFAANTAIHDDVAHGCLLCFDVGLKKFVDLSANVAYLNNKAEKAFPVYRDPVFHGYLSVINDKNSPLGGKPGFGTGECPCKQYKVIIRTLDGTGNEVKYYDVRVASVRTGQMTEVSGGQSPYTAYLYPGAYVASSHYMDEDVETPFMVGGKPQEVKLKIKPEETPTPEPSPTPTSSPTPTPIPKETPTPEPSITPAPSRTPQPGAIGGYLHLGTNTMWGRGPSGSALSQYFFTPEQSGNYTFFVQTYRPYDAVQSLSFDVSGYRWGNMVREMNDSSFELRLENAKEIIERGSNSLGTYESYNKLGHNSSYKYDSYLKNVMNLYLQEGVTYEISLTANGNYETVNISLDPDPTPTPLPTPMPIPEVTAGPYSGYLHLGENMMYGTLGRDEDIYPEYHFIPERSGYYTFTTPSNNEWILWHFTISIHNISGGYYALVGNRGETIKEGRIWITPYSLQCELTKTGGLSETDIERLGIGDKDLGYLQLIHDWSVHEDHNYTEMRVYLTKGIEYEVKLFSSHDSVGRYENINITYSE